MSAVHDRKRSFKDLMSRRRDMSIAEHAKCLVDAAVHEDDLDIPCVSDVIEVALADKRAPAIFKQALKRIPNDKAITFEMDAMCFSAMLRKKFTTGKGSTLRATLFGVLLAGQAEDMRSVVNDDRLYVAIRDSMRSSHMIGTTDHVYFASTPCGPFAVPIIPPYVLRPILNGFIAHHEHHVTAGGGFPVQPVADVRLTDPVLVDLLKPYDYLSTARERVVYKPVKCADKSETAPLEQVMLVGCCVMDDLAGGTVDDVTFRLQSVLEPVLPERLSPAQHYFETFFDYFPPDFPPKAFGKIMAHRQAYRHDLEGAFAEEMIARLHALEIPALVNGPYMWHETSEAAVSACLAHVFQWELTRLGLAQGDVETAHVVLSDGFLIITLRTKDTLTGRLALPLNVAAMAIQQMFEMLKLMAPAVYHHATLEAFIQATEHGKMNPLALIKD